MVTFGYGITFDVENLSFAVFDRDQSAQSRQLVESFAGSRYFRQQPPLRSEVEIDRRLRAGELRLAIEHPAGFRSRPAQRPQARGRVLPRRRRSVPRRDRARLCAGHRAVLRAGSRAPHLRGSSPRSCPLQVEPRFRYNQDFRSVFALTPGCIMIFLILFPSMLAALGVVREREIGSISNLYASPATVGEFLLGKQAALHRPRLRELPQPGDARRHPVRRDREGLGGRAGLAAVLYIFAATALGTLISTFVRTQVAAIIATAIITTVPAINFSGYLYPAATAGGRPDVSWAWAFRRSGSRTSASARSPKRAISRPSIPNTWFCSRFGLGFPGGREPALAQAGGLTMRPWLANVFRLGLKELASLASDKVLAVFIVYSFSFSIYSHATGVKTEVANAPVPWSMPTARRSRRAFRTACSSHISVARSSSIAPRSTARWTVGAYTFVLDIPPRLEADLLRGPRPGAAAQHRRDRDDPGRRRRQLHRMRSCSRRPASFLQSRGIEAAAAHCGRQPRLLQSQPRGRPVPGRHGGAGAHHHAVDPAGRRRRHPRAGARHHRASAGHADPGERDRRRQDLGQRPR